MTRDEFDSWLDSPERASLVEAATRWMDGAGEDGGARRLRFAAGLVLDAVRGRRFRAVFLSNPLGPSVDAHRPAFHLDSNVAEAVDHLMALVRPPRSHLSIHDYLRPLPQRFAPLARFLARAPVQLRLTAVPFFSLFTLLPASPLALLRLSAHPRDGTFRVFYPDPNLDLPHFLLRRPAPLPLHPLLRDCLLRLARLHA
jgi:hypothetical protein